jgi:hypothetical protein
MSRDPWPNLRPGISDVGKKMLAVTPGSSDFANASLIYAAAAGDVTYIPEQNANADTVTETVAQGWVSPVLVRRVTAATATIYQVLTA